MRWSYTLFKNRAISAKSWSVFVLLGLSTFISAQAAPSTNAETPTPPTTALSAPHRLKVSEISTSQLLIQKVAPKYPESSLRAGMQGTVVLAVTIDTSGAVQQVTVVSGDSILAQSAEEAVWQWKYKPYLIEGTAVAIETQVTLDFHVASRNPPTPPPLGSFRENTYSNEYFNLFYPLSRDWVRETELIRKRFSAGNPPVGTNVLLSEVHIPQDNTELRADSSFTLLAVSRSSLAAAENCRLYLDTLANTVEAGKKAKQRPE